MGTHFHNTQRMEKLTMYDMENIFLALEILKPKLDVRYHNIQESAAMASYPESTKMESSINNDFKIEGKEFTQIELSFMKKVMDMAIADLEEAWTPVHRIDATYLRTEINPQFVGVVPPSDVIIATTLEIEFESASGTIMMHHESHDAYRCL